MRHVCEAEEKAGEAKCLACAGQNAAKLQKACTQPELEKICNGTAPSPSPSPPSPRGGGCDYDQEAGALWNQRLKQYLIANGVAVVIIVRPTVSPLQYLSCRILSSIRLTRRRRICDAVYFFFFSSDTTASLHHCLQNPIQEDSWDAGPWWWTGGVDHPFMAEVFTQMKAGKMGKLNTDAVVIRGWSGGAQMVSWLSQVIASNKTFDGIMTMKGGVMMSGGSYLCYNDVSDPTNPPGAAPIGSCQGCTEGGPSHCAGDPKCSSCDATVKTYCGQCCPRNFTEPYFQENPSKYSEHVPMFLGQTSKTDNHADLCACRNYYDTLVANGVSKSKLVLMGEDDESCFCIGNPKEPTAAGSPYSSKCDAKWGTQCGVMGGTDCCIDHTLAFAAMVEPAVDFVLDVTA